jgi:6,7-dimethyl-8-ribityllumazine synthase
VTTTGTATEAVSFPNARHYRFAVVVSRYHRHLTERLEKGALNCFEKHGVPKKNISVVYCPGAFELPQVAHRLLSGGRWDAVVCLGVVIRGETKHFEYVAAEAARGIQQGALLHGRPILFGVLTTDNEQQARERSGGKHGNKGWEAALAAIEMVTLFERLSPKRRSRRK